MATSGDLEFVALAPSGFERTLADELRILGCSNVRPLRGSVSFFASLETAYRACLWTRLASRIVHVIDRVDSRDADELYESCMSIGWEEHVPQGATIAVEARGRSEQIHDTRFAALRVKDAICDRLREVRGTRPYVDAKEPDVRVVCTVREARSTLAIDMSGSLVDRGYRVRERLHSSASTSGYMREDMAALLLELAGWTKACKRSKSCRLVDPLASAATLAVEAACIACDKASGLSRERWGFEGWGGHDPTLWKELLDEANERFSNGLECGVRITVAASDKGVRAELFEMLEKAGVSPVVDVQACGPTLIDLGNEQLKDTFVCCMVPDDAASPLRGELPARLAALSSLTRTPVLAEASLAALSSSDALEKLLGRSADRTVEVVNGNAPAHIQVFPSAAQEARRAAVADRVVESVRDRGEVDVRQRLDAEAVAAQVEMPVVTLPSGEALPVLVAASDQFAARLARVTKMRAKWARSEGVSCYRVYDADLPDYPLTIDLYNGSSTTPGKWLVISEYAAPRSVDPALAARRLADALSIAPRILGVDSSDVFFKVRKRDSGGSQYSYHSDEHRGAIVEEGGLLFEVNFSDYLDTGLFLDHRMVRSLIRQMAPRARFLNLFAYTGSASCYAADGGAYTTTTVDMSNTYIEWARRNMEQNGFAGDRHEFVQADVVSWISQQRRTANRWNLIYIDPPTFSNSSRMRKRGFDVQNDHAELIIGASRLLARGGTIIFSCNMRKFEPDVDKLASAGVAIDDITDKTIPEDYERNRQIHRCYLAYRSN